MKMIDKIFNNLAKYSESKIINLKKEKECLHEVLDL